MGHFNHSAKSSYLLKQKQYDLKHKQHRLIQSVATRWNSSYCMMERILEQQQPLSATLSQLRKSDLMPTDSEISTMYDFVQFMKPFVEITEAIGSEKWAFISSVRPLIYQITNKYLLCSEDDSPLVKQMKQQMKQQMITKVNEYYGDGCDLEVLNKCMLLDPRFKNVSFASSDILLNELTEVSRNRVSVAATASSSHVPSSSATTSSTPVSRHKEGKLMKLLADIVHTPDDSLTNPSEKACIRCRYRLSHHFQLPATPCIL